MSTVDASGNLHDGVGRFAGRAAVSAGYDLGAVASCASITRANNASYATARRNQTRHKKSLMQAVAAIEARLAVGCGEREKVGKKFVRGYRDQRERYAKQQRLQTLKARLVEVTTDLDTGRASICEGGRALAKKRHNPEDAALTYEQWRAAWERERTWFHANGSGDEPFGNLTITVSPDGLVSIRMPETLAHLANAPRKRFTLEHRLSFPYRGEEWADRVTPHDGRSQAVSYRVTRHPRSGWTVTASWSDSDDWTPSQAPLVRPFGLDLNADHVAGWVLDAHVNPVGAPIDFPATWDGLSTGQRDALVRQVVTRIIRTAKARGCDSIIIIEDLDFADARTTGRETMGRGRKGKRFRKTVAGMPTAKFRAHIQAACHRAGIRLIAVNPAYTSKWGDQHWRKPTSTRTRATTRHQAAALVIARRGQGLPARRKAGLIPPHG